MVKRKNLTRVAIYALAFFVLWGVVAGSGPARAVTETVEAITPAEHDSYVNSGDISNYGGQQWFIIGDYFSDFTEAYFYFNCSDRPAGWTKAEVRLDFYHVSATLSVNVSRVLDAWDEYTITWVNKPAYGPSLKEILVAQEQVYAIDVTAIATGTNISLCVNASDFMQTGYIQGRAREGGSSDLFPPPRLVWTYSREVTSRIPGYDLGILLGSLLAGVLAVAAWQCRKKGTRIRHT